MQGRSGQAGEHAQPMQTAACALGTPCVCAHTQVTCACRPHVPHASPASVHTPKQHGVPQPTCSGLPATSLPCRSYAAKRCWLGMRTVSCANPDVSS